MVETVQKDCGLGGMVQKVEEVQEVQGSKFKVQSLRFKV